MASSSNAANRPRMTLTLSRSISSWALVLAPAGLPPVSAEMNSILRPANVLLFSFSSVAMPCSIWMPPCASGPVFTVSRPILNGADCAIAGAFNVKALTPPRIPFSTVLRRSFMGVSLPSVGVVRLDRALASDRMRQGFHPRYFPYAKSHLVMHCARGLPIRRRLRRDDRQQQIGLAAAAEMQNVPAAEHIRRTVDRVVMHERAAAGHRVLHVGETGGLPGMLVILAAAAQPDAVAGGNDDGSRPDFHIELDDLPGLQRLQFVMRVVGPIRRGTLRVELAMRGAQPALPDGRMRIEGALEHHLVQIGREHPQHEKEIGIAGRGGDQQLCGRRAGDLGLLRQRRGQKREAVAQRIEAHAGPSRAGRLLERMLDGIEIELRPNRARERPLVLPARDESVEPAHLQQHAWLPAPAAVDALEEMVEELALQLAAV